MAGNVAFGMEAEQDGVVTENGFAHDAHLAVDGSLSRTSCAKLPSATWWTVQFFQTCVVDRVTITLPRNMLQAGNCFMISVWV